MEQKFDEKSVQKAMQLARSPAGQQLMALLKQTPPEVLQKASTQASNGDVEQLRKTLETFMASEDVRKLLKQLGG